MWKSAPHSHLQEQTPVLLQASPGPVVRARSSSCSETPLSSWPPRRLLAVALGQEEMLYVETPAVHER